VWQSPVTRPSIELFTVLDLRNTLLIGFVTTSASVLLMVACDTSPTRPSGLLPQGAAPAYPTRIELVGPDSVAPGQTAQFTAIQHRSDGTTVDVTNSATWRSFQPNVLSVSGTGLVTALALGEATIQVISGPAAARIVLALPTGTFRLVGLVGEADSPTSPVAGARVEASGGSAPGPSVLSGLEGRYRLYGVPGSAEIRVTKDGYQPLVQNLVLTAHQTTNFTLALVSPRPALAGNYTLTINVADECRSGLPEETWTRQYLATITQDGALLDVTLSGATFVLDQSGNGDGFRGRAQPGQAVFTLKANDFYYYRTIGDIVEELSPSLFVSMSGSVVADVIQGGRIAGSLNGEIATFGSDPRRFPPPQRFCRSAGHQFVLTR